MKMCYLALALCSSLLAQTVKLTSLDWPPYSEASLPKKGLSVSIVNEAFLAMGYTLEVDFFPWKRTVALAKKGEEYSGYLPEYYAEHLEENCYFSDSIGTSVLGFVESKKNPIAWQSIADLRTYTIGVVQGYVNTYAFDKMVEQGAIKTETAMNDLQNIKKVALQRIDTALIDQYVLAYFLASSKTGPTCKNSLRFHAQPLQTQHLYVCFNKTSKGKKLVEILNQGLLKIDIEAITKAYLKSLH